MIPRILIFVFVENKIAYLTDRLLLPRRTTFGIRIAFQSKREWSRNVCAQPERLIDYRRQPTTTTYGMMRLSKIVLRNKTHNWPNWTNTAVDCLWKDGWIPVLVKINLIPARPVKISNTMRLFWYPLLHLYYLINIFVRRDVSEEKSFVRTQKSHILCYTTCCASCTKIQFQGQLVHICILLEQRLQPDGKETNKKEWETNRINEIHGIKW